MVISRVIQVVEWTVPNTLEAFNFANGSYSYLGETIVNWPFNEITVRNLSEDTLYFTYTNGSFALDGTDLQGVHILPGNQTITIAHIKNLFNLKFKLDGTGHIEFTCLRYKNF